MGIVRGARTLVPGGEVTIQPNDQVFVLVPAGQVAQVVYLLGKEAGRLRHCMILGGSARAGSAAGARPTAWR
jgi:trk system potassium uptake protein TrkA